MPDGVDEATQIEKWELLDYDNEVEPVLQVLVGRTLSQSRIELIENWEKEEKLKRLVYPLDPLKDHFVCGEFRENTRKSETQSLW